MEVTISLKDSNNKIRLNCSLTWQESNVFCFMLDDDKTVRKYPMQNVFFIEFDENTNKHILLKTKKEL